MGAPTRQRPPNEQEEAKVSGGEMEALRGRTGDQLWSDLETPRGGSLRGITPLPFRHPRALWSALPAWRWGGAPGNGYHQSVCPGRRELGTGLPASASLMGDSGPSSQPSRFFLNLSQVRGSLGWFRNSSVASRERSGLNGQEEPTFLSASVSSSIIWGS